MLLKFPIVGFADERLAGVEVPAAVKDSLRLDKLELKVPVVELMRELRTGEMVVPVFEVTLGLVSDTEELMLAEIDGVMDGLRVLLPYASVEEVTVAGGEIDAV